MSADGGGLGSDDDGVVPGARALFRAEARKLGFARVGFAPVEPFARFALYQAWLERGYAGDMRYLVEQAEPRRSPRALFDRARSVVTVALSYAHGDPVDVPLDRLLGARGTIARYARGADYHAVLKDKLRALAAAVGARLGRSLGWLACVDTAPLLEREAAAAAGLGFFGKNTLLIAPGLGSYFVLGELVTDVACTPEAGDAEDEAAAAAPRCGQCTRCLDACPTGAFVDAHTLDARRCISYLTIENAGPIPRELRPLVGDHVFGCDVCQSVCPFNAGSGDAAPAPELRPRPGYGRPALVRLLGLGAAQFRKWQQASALRRVHRAQLLRNVAVALGNVGGAAELPALGQALAERSPLVRAHVAWAIGRIAARAGAALPAAATTAARALVAAQLGHEDDAEARVELGVALAALAAIDSR